MRAKVRIEARLTDGGEWVVWLSPANLLIAMQGGPTLGEALSDFANYLQDFTDALVDDRERLGPMPRNQLRALMGMGLAPSNTPAEPGPGA